MGKNCQLTGKKPTPGRKYAIRGISKKKKGIGLNITGKTKRKFTPNLQKKRFYIPSEKRWVTLSISAEGMRTIDKIGIEAAVAKMRKKGQKV